MSVSTTCRVYWVNLYSRVSEVNQVTASCDSSLRRCTLNKGGEGLSATCDSSLQYPGSTNPTYSSFFCSCGSNTVQVPSGVDCASKCYNLTTSFSKCSYIELYFGYTSGSASSGVLEDLCSPFNCDTQGVLCTDSTDLIYHCDNQEHDSPSGSSTHSYVCNCKGPAAVPDIYQNVNKRQGTACGNAVISSTKRTSSPTALINQTVATSLPNSTQTKTTAVTATTGSAAATVKPNDGSSGRTSLRKWSLCTALLVSYLFVQN